MRKQILFAAAGFALAASATLTGASPAQASNAPWCAQTISGGDARMCNFFSFQQCLSYVSGMGGTCSENHAEWYESQASHVVPVNPGRVRHERRPRVRHWVN